MDGVYVESLVSSETVSDPAVLATRLAAENDQLRSEKMGQLNPRTWLEWYLDSCAKEGGKAPTDIQSFLPWNLSPEQRRALGGEVAPRHPDSS